MKKRKCLKCGYEWVPRVDNPKHCPRCFTWLIPSHTNPDQDKPVPTRPAQTSPDQTSPNQTKKG